MDTTGVRLGLLLALTIPAPGLTQEPELEPHIFPSGLTVGTGMGHHSIRGGHPVRVHRAVDATHCAAEEGGES
jgi:hypothetical protein